MDSTTIRPMLHVAVADESPPEDLLLIAGEPEPLSMQLLAAGYQRGLPATVSVSSFAVDAYCYGRMACATQPKSGVRQVPLSTPDASGNTCRFVQESAAVGQKLVIFSIERNGSLPTFPQIEPDTAKQRLIDWDIGLAVPALMGDGRTYRFAATGYYLYALAQDPNPANGLPTGVVPTDTISPSQYVVTGTNFKPAF